MNKIKQLLLFSGLLFLASVLDAQTAGPMHILSMEEYQKAKTFTVKDLDNDSYVKIENTYSIFFLA